MLRVYNCFLPFTFFVLRVLAPILPKIQSTLQSREGWRERWQAGTANLREPRILFHAASVGELEQTRPVLEYWRGKARAAFLLSYFSPSVPSVVKDWSFVDYADFLPLDTSSNMQDFFDLVRPDFIVLNRYDLWPNLLAEARARNVPVALVNASTPPLGLWGRLSLKFRQFLFRDIKVWTYVDGVSAGLWEPFLDQTANALVTGDPRVDRALERVRRGGKGRQVVDEIRRRWQFDAERTIVAGSTWSEDEELLLGTLTKLRERNEFASTKMIIVPHEPSRDHIRELITRCGKHDHSFVLYSELIRQTEVSEARLLIVDILGALTEIYALGNTTFVGGGFGRSVHSVIEPAAHGVPTAFGPKFQRMPEAKTLVLMGGAFAVSGYMQYQDLADWFISTLRGGRNFTKVREVIHLFIQMHAGAAERVAIFLEEQFQRLYRKLDSNREF